MTESQTCAACDAAMVARLAIRSLLLLGAVAVAYLALSLLDRAAHADPGQSSPALPPVAAPVAQSVTKSPRPSADTLPAPQTLVGTVEDTLTRTVAVADTAVRTTTDPGLTAVVPAVSTAVLGEPAVTSSVSNTSVSNTSVSNTSTAENPVAGEHSTAETSTAQSSAGQGSMAGSVPATTHVLTPAVLAPPLAVGFPSSPCSVPACPPMRAGAAASSATDAYPARRTSADVHRPA